MDYYKILNIEPNANENDIRKAYKKLAMKYHPDKNFGNKEAEENFKKVAKAYEILSDKNKRNIYDMTGNVADNINIDPFSIFNSIFSSVKVEVFSFNSINNKSEDIYYNVHAKLEDIYNMCIKTISLSHKRLINNSYKDVVEDYKVPLYIKESIYPNKAHDKTNCNNRGDVIINVYEKPNEKFKRINEYDLIYAQTITIDDVYNGFQFSMQHLDGKMRNIKSKKGDLINQGYFYQKIEKMGLYNPDEDKRADLFIRYIIDFDKKYKLEENNEYETIIANNCSYDDIYKNYVF